MFNSFETNLKMFSLIDSTIPSVGTTICWPHDGLPREFPNIALVSFLIVMSHGIDIQTDKWI